MSDVSIAPRRRLSAAVHQNRTLSRTGVLERGFSRLFQGLVYAQIWEDPVVDMAALDIGPEDDLVCIASGGCNLMSYLTAGPRSLSAVDLSPAHVALNRLKLAAAIHLPEHAQFYDMFGHADRPEAAALYDRHIAPHLDGKSRSYWESRWRLRKRRIDMLSHGFHRFGVLGRFIGVAHMASRLGGVRYDAFFEAKSLEDQRAFFDEHVAPLFDKWLVRTLARRRASLFGLGIPPAQYDKLAADADGDIIPVLRERIRVLMCDHPVSENYFAWQAFGRGYDPQGTGPVPPYLQVGKWQALKANAPRATIENHALTDMLARAPDGSKSCFSFLDAQDWMTDGQLDALWTQVTRVARPGARAIFRTGGAPDILPGRLREDILAQWDRDTERGRELHAQDRSAIYGGFHIYRRRG